MADSINTITEHFQLNKEILRKDFYSTKNHDERAWFLEKFDKNLRQPIQEKFYKFLIKHKIHIPFFDWFENYVEEQNIENYTFKRVKSVNTFWQTKTGLKVESDFPPKQLYQILGLRLGDIPIVALPFKTKDLSKETEISKDIQSLKEQIITQILTCKL